MKLWYENHLGETLYVSGFPFLLETAPNFAYEWQYNATGSNKKGSKITKFYRNTKEMDDTLIIRTRTEAEMYARMKEFFEVVEQDIISMKPGKLKLEDGTYLSCYIIASNMSSIHRQTRKNERKVKIVSPYPFWINEAIRDFFPQAAEENHDEFLDYNYDYGYDYMHGVKGVARWSVDHYTDSEFRLTVFGYCENPVVRINGHPYQVFTTLESNDYLIIDSKEKTVTKWISGAVQENVYDLRLKEHSVFERIPSGNLTFTWDGTFGFRLKLFLERSEPAW